MKARTLLGVACLALLVAVACDRVDASSHDDDVRVRVEHVGLDANSSPVVVLEELAGERWLPIWIGSAEAHSIGVHMAEHESPRPNSHDLAQRLIEGLSGEVERVVVTELRSGTYFATLTLRRSDGPVDIDARPSDAIAIALRTGAPIYVREHLFAEGGGEDENDSAEAI